MNRLKAMTVSRAGNSTSGKASNQAGSIDMAATFGSHPDRRSRASQEERKTRRDLVIRSKRQL
jgi:hypothetical protein